MRFDRRSLLRFGALGMGAVTAGCDRVQASPAGQDALGFGNWLTYRTQRLILGDSLAKEFPKSAISAHFRPNGTVDPKDPDYVALAKSKFVDWRLQVGGLVDRPLSLSLADIRALPARTQITRHDCVEGWSCIGQWTGTQLSHVLDAAGVKKEARFVVFHCADSMDMNSLDSTDASDADKAGATQGGPKPESSRYYESIDFVDARHPQTILAYEMNGAPLTIPYGAPLRLRVERQLGYKMPKYLMRVDLVDDYSNIRDGRGGYWEDQGYDWFAGT